MEFLKKRKSIRKYTSEDISRELLNELLEVSSRASTMGNMQLYSVVVTRDEEMKEKLSPVHFNQPMVKGAPVVLTFCADFNRFCKWCEQRGANPGYDNFLSFMNAVSDTLLFTENFCNLAEQKGLGICYLGTTIYNSEQIIDILGLPKLVFPVATITVGYPDEGPLQPDRLPLRGIVHDETYADYTSEMIDDIYEYKESLPENKEFVNINHTPSLAHIFTDIRYKKGDNELISDALLKVLKNQGFLA